MPRAFIFSPSFAGQEAIGLARKGAKVVRPWDHHARKNPPSPAGKMDGDNLHYKK